jgi:probable F420-dependent oxidoreductase
MKIWLIAPWCSAEDLVVLAKHAEALGFEGVMGADHGFVPKTMANAYLYSEDGKPPITGDMPYPDVWSSIGAMAAVTKHIKFSTAVYVLPLRHPIEVAKATGTLARLSDNRVILGAGSGWMKEEFDVYGVNFKTRGKRMNEMIDVMRKLWAGGYVEHRGGFFDFPPLQLAPAPTQSVPIYIGGASEPALKRAARLGQGWIGAGNDIDEVPEILQKLSDYRSEYSRDQEAFETVIAVNQLDQVDEVKRLEENGMTSTVFGFKDSTQPLSEKFKQMDAFAKFLMPALA